MPPAAASAQLAILVSALAVGCSQSNSVAPASAKAAGPPAANRVAVAVASLESWPRTVRVQGSLLAFENAVIGSKIAGRVESVDVDLGSVVRRGQPLVVLDRSELELRLRLARSQLQQACAAIDLTPDDDERQVNLENAAPVMLERALLDEAQSALDRNKPLVASRAITSAQFDALVAALRAAQARYNSALNAVREQIALIGVRRTELAIAQQQLTDARILAPFDGVVDERRIAPGEYVQVGQAVVTLIRSDRLRFTAGVPESRAGQVRLGQPVVLQVKGAPSPPPAVVSRVSPIVMQTSRSVRIEADVPNEAGKLRAGLFAEADVVVDAGAKVLTLPASAVAQFAGVQKVWQVVDNQARQATVRIGREEQGRVEILAGLSAGDQVVAVADQGRDGPVVASAAPAPAQAPDS